MTQIKTVCVDKVAYEAVLRNSIRVNDLEAENQQLKELLYNSMVYLNCHIDNDGNVFVNGVSTSSFIKEIDNAIGEQR